MCASVNLVVNHAGSSGQQQARRRRIQQGSEHSTSPRAVSFLMGTEGYVPMYPRTQSPPAHLIPHLALGSSTTTRPDRRRAHPRNRYVPGAAVRGYMVPPPSRTHTAAQAGCVTAMFPAHRRLGSIFVSFLAPSNHGHAGIMRLQRYKRQRYLWPSYLGCAAHRLLMPSLLPLPSLASHLRQGMAGHGRALTDRLTPLQHAFWAFVLSKWAILE
jgi:hypothetical protein